MNDAFEQYIQSNHIDDDRLLEALRTYLAEQLDYLPEEDMLSEMSDKTDTIEIKQLLWQLERDKASLVGAASIILGSVWNDPDQRELVEEAINNANQKLPIIRTGIIATVAMYGMFLIATGGVQEHSMTTIRPDGSIEAEHTVYQPPTAPLQTVVALFSKAGPRA